VTVMAVRGGGTVRVGLDGTGCEIGRTAGHARALRDRLARCVTAAGRQGGGRRPGRAGRMGSVSGLNHCGRGVGPGAGIEVKDCARVPAEVVARFKGGHRQIGSEVTATRVTALSLTCDVSASNGKREVPARDVISCLIRSDRSAGNCTSVAMRHVWR
jgi:hypothetical protein